MPVKFEQNCMDQTTRNFESFDKKTGFLPFLTFEELTPILEDFPTAEIDF